MDSRFRHLRHCCCRREVIYKKEEIGRTFRMCEKEREQVKFEKTCKRKKGKKFKK